MGITAFFYAATATLDEVEAALRSTYPAELATAVTDVRPAVADSTALDQFYDDPRPVVALWQDGPFSCWAESNVGLADEAPLTALSDQLGTVLFAMIADHGGSYAFAVFRDGQVVRWLQNDWEPQGSPIPEEAGIARETLSDSDVAVMWSRFGLSPYFTGVPPFRVLIGEPQFDYGAAMK
jgi:hypothetical protein